MPAIALGDSISICAPWQASQEDMSRSSSQTRNWRQFTRHCKSSYLLETLFKEGDCEHAIIDAKLHQLCWVAADTLEADSVLQVRTK